jgi:hypothetical protein
MTPLSLLVLLLPLPPPAMTPAPATEDMETEVVVDIACDIATEDKGIDMEVEVDIGMDIGVEVDVDREIGMEVVVDIDMGMEMGADIDMDMEREVVADVVTDHSTVADVEVPISDNDVAPAAIPVLILWLAEPMSMDAQGDDSDTGIVIDVMVVEIGAAEAEEDGQTHPS